MDAPKHTVCTLTAAGTNVCCPAEALERKPHGPDNLTVFATCWGPAPAREANAAEVARRWNAHEGLVAAGEAVMRLVDEVVLPALIGPMADDGPKRLTSTMALLEAALATARP